MYAEFLSKAGTRLADPALTEAAAAVAHTATLWRALAAWLLDDRVPVFRQCRAQVAADGCPMGPDALARAVALAETASEALDADFYPALGERLTALLAAERAARDALDRATP